MKIKIFFLLSAFLVGSRVAMGQFAAVAAGIGSSGEWQTSIEVANPGDSPISVLVSEFAGQDIFFGCDFGCNVMGVDVPPHGTAEIPVTGGIINPENNPYISAIPSGHLFTLFLSPVTSYPPPTPAPVLVARVRAINPVTGAQAEYPVVSLDTLMHRANPSELTFPGVQGGRSGHCNLILTSIDARTHDVRPLNAQLDLYASQGNLIGSEKIDASECVAGLNFGCANMFVVDVARRLGAGDLAGGQLHVHQISGGDVIWGELACTSPGDGHFSVVPGAQP